MTCGPGTFGDWFVPDWIGAVSISAACLEHDKAYASHKTSRKVADARFRRAMLAAGSELVGAVGRSYRRRVFVYWLAVRVLGGFSWRGARSA